MASVLRVIGAKKDRRDPHSAVLRLSYTIEEERSLLTARSVSRDLIVKLLEPPGLQINAIRATSALLELPTRKPLVAQLTMNAPGEL